MSTTGNLFGSSLSASDQSTRTAQHRRWAFLDANSNRSFVSSEVSATPSSNTLEEQLFNAKAQLKISLSQISMHLPEIWRESTFHQIDLLHAMDDWEDDSNFISAESFKTFLRFVVFSAPNELPGLAVAPNGNLVASWLRGDARIYIEFLANDVANGIFAKSTRRGPEAVSWRGPITNLRQFIGLFGIGSCLGW